MKNSKFILVMAAFIGSYASFAMAESQSQTQTPSKGGWLKSMGQAAVQAGVQALSPQAKATVDEANKLGTPKAQENFLVTKAKEFLGAGNYDTALQVANYVITTLNSKSVDAQKIMADAKAALAKMAQDKMNQLQSQSAPGQKAQQAQSTATQAQTEAQSTVNGVKNILGSFGNASKK